MPRGHESPRIQTRQPNLPPPRIRNPSVHPARPRLECHTRAHQPGGFISKLGLPPTPGLSKVAESRFGPAQTSRDRAPSWPQFSLPLLAGGPTLRPGAHSFLAVAGGFVQLGALQEPSGRTAHISYPVHSRPRLGKYCDGRLPRIWLSGRFILFSSDLWSCEWLDLGNWGICVLYFF